MSFFSSLIETEDKKSIDENIEIIVENFKTQIEEITVANFVDDLQLYDISRLNNIDEIDLNIYIWTFSVYKDNDYFIQTLRLKGINNDIISEIKSIKNNIYVKQKDLAVKIINNIYRYF